MSHPSPRETRAPSRARPTAVVLAVLALAVGGGLALFVSSRTFLTVHVTRARPLPDLDVHVAGRTLQPAIAGLAVVLLAGVVAVPAVRGRARLVVGAVLVLTAAALVWRCALALTTPRPARVRELVLAARTGTTLDAGARLAAHPHPAWPLLGLLAAVFGGAGAVVTAARGTGWRGLGARYEAPAPSITAGSGAAGTHAAGSDVAAPAATPPPPDRDDGSAEAEQARRARRDLALWQSLDRGEDPTLGAAADPGDAPDEERRDSTAPASRSRPGPAHDTARNQGTGSPIGGPESDPPDADTD